MVLLLPLLLLRHHCVLVFVVFACCVFVCFLFNVVVDCCVLLSFAISMCFVALIVFGFGDSVVAKVVATIIVYDVVDLTYGCFCYRASCCFYRCRWSELQCCSVLDVFGDQQTTATTNDNTKLQERQE